MTDEQAEAVGWAMDVAHSRAKTETDPDLKAIHSERCAVLSKMLRERPGSDAITEEKVAEAVREVFVPLLVRRTPLTGIGAHHVVEGAMPEVLRRLKEGAHLG